MRKSTLLLFAFCFVVMPIITSAEKGETNYTCEVEFVTAEGMSKSSHAKAQIYAEETTKQISRKWVHVQAELPEPSGPFDSYEVIAYIPGKKSWLFPLKSVVINDETHWIGKKEISPKHTPKIMKIRLIDTTTNKKGSVLLLQDEIKCK